MQLRVISQVATEAPVGLGTEIAQRQRKPRMRMDDVTVAAEESDTEQAQAVGFAFDALEH